MEDPGFEQTQTDDDPVVGVSWYDAKAFCEWLTLRERAAGRLPPDREYRLPTDNEWSVAVGLNEDPAKSPKACENSGTTPGASGQTENPRLKGQAITPEPRSKMAIGRKSLNVSRASMTHMPEPPQWDRLRRTGSGFSTWAEMSGSGAKMSFPAESE
jgi:hypothetical protein